ncbi:MAG TPA: hypothetical protein VF943_12615 [Burkholderiales bacterium]
MSAGGPGRGCPLSYRYDPAFVFREIDLEVESLWVAGGLYGNPLALEVLLERYERERGSKALVFNGDFHWFDVDPRDFSDVNQTVLEFSAIRGNVETELTQPADGAGCGCGYPDWVDDGTVERSNRILERLRATAGTFPEDLGRLAALPMTLVASIGGERVAVVHGDADSLAGWNFSQECLASPASRAAALTSFSRANVSVFASSHTCLPVLQCFPGPRLIVNNGAAGMPNFHGTRFGLATRISLYPSNESLYSQRASRLFVEAVKLEYDHLAWERRFLAQWPSGSDAHRSYYERIVDGPRYAVREALRAEAALAA